MTDTAARKANILSPLSGGALDSLKIIAFIFLMIDTANMAWHGGSIPAMMFASRIAYPLAAFVLACHMLRGFNIRKYIILLTVIGLAIWPLSHLAVQDTYMNVLLTLALAAAFMWAAEKMTDGVRNGLVMASCLLMAFPQINDYGAAGIVLPAAILAVLRGRAGAWPAMLMALAFINLSGFGLIIRGSSDAFTGVVKVVGMGGAMLAICSILPWLFIRLCARISEGGARFLPKYLLHVLYPLHVLVIWLVK